MNFLDKIYLFLARIFAEEAQTVVFVGSEQFESQRLHFLCIDFNHES